MSSVTQEKLADAVERLSRSKADEEAWQVLVSCLWPLIVAINFRILRGDRGLAQDAGQETLLRIYRYVHFEEFAKKPAEFESYARAIARNVGRSYLARLLREPSYEYEELEGQNEPDPHKESREQITIQKDEISSILAGLSPDEQLLAKLMQDGASLDEIANTFGISYSNAAVRVHRLRLVLSRSLKMR